MTRSEAAFLFSAERLFDQEPELYFWTFTWKDVMPDWYYANSWSRFVDKLSYMYGGTLRGLKVVELHKQHGIHYHCLLNKRVWVGEVRRVAERFGLGRVHVKRADRGAITYLSKYLSKQFISKNKLHARVGRWGTIGGFRSCKVKDVEIDSPFHRRIKRAQEITGLKKIPFPLAAAIFRERDVTDQKLITACRRFLGTGNTSMLWSDNPVLFSPESCRRNLEAVRQ